MKANYKLFERIEEIGAELTGYTSALLAISSAAYNGDKFTTYAPGLSSVTCKLIDLANEVNDIVANVELLKSKKPSTE